MKLRVESDGDRIPKDVYLVDESGTRVATIDLNAPDRTRFDFARLLAAAFNQKTKSKEITK